MEMRDAFKKVGITGVGGGNPSGTQKQWGSKQQDQQRKIEPPKIVFRANGELRCELITSEAEKWADLLKGVTPTQLRNFYNEVKAIQSRIEAGGLSSNRAMIGMLKSKAAYAYARADRSKKAGFEYLKNMIEQCVDLSVKDNTEQSFNDFALFFEAVMGFFKEGR